MESENMSIRDEYINLYRIYRASKLLNLDIMFDRAMKDDNTDLITSLRATRRRWLDFTTTITSNDRTTLIKMWPEDFPELPKWFTNPETIDQPGQALVIDCSDSKKTYTIGQL
jgi:hypothetical protein